MRSISCHITPLVINNFRHGDTHTHAHTNDPHRINFKKQVCTGQQLTHAWFKKQCFAAWSSLSKLLILSTSGGLEHLKWQCFAVSSLWSKLSSLSKPGGIGRPFDFTSFSTRPVLVLGHPFCTPGVLLRYKVGKHYYMTVDQQHWLFDKQSLKMTSQIQCNHIGENLAA